MFSHLSACLANNLGNSQPQGLYTVGRKKSIAEVSTKSEIEAILESIRTLGYSTLKPPGTTKTMEQILNDTNNEPSYEAYGLNDHGFVTEHSNEEQSEPIQGPSEASEPELFQSPPPIQSSMLIPSPVLRQPMTFDDSRDNSWNTTYTADESYNDIEYIQQGFMPVSDPPAIITPRRISSRPR